jgi:hypothetical protein
MTTVEPPVEPPSGELPTGGSPSGELPSGGSPSGELPSGGSPGPARRRRGFLPGAIALAALLILGVLFGAGDLQHRSPSTLSGSSVASEIALAIQAQGNTARTPTVTCPEREPVRAGFRFECTLGGHPPRTLYVTEVNSRAGVRWSFSP